MGPERRNRAILLAALIVLLAAVVTYQWWPRPSSVRGHSQITPSHFVFNIGRRKGKSKTFGGLSRGS